MRTLRQIWHDLVLGERGVAAVEFAAVLPFLLVTFLGSYEVTQGILVQRKVSLTAGTLANLVGQYTTINANNQMPDILQAAVQILAPWPSGSATVIVSLITIDNSGNATITWSKSLNGTAHPTGQAVSLPAGLNIKNTTLVHGEAFYAYQPATLDFLHLGTINLGASVYMAPRDSSTINLA